MLNYARLPAWAHQRCINLKSSEGAKCDRIFSVLFSLALKRNTDTDLSHPLTMQEIAGLNGISLRSAYRYIDTLVRASLIKHHSYSNGKFVFNLVCLRKDAEPDELDDIFGGDEDGSNPETIESVLRRDGSGKPDKLA